MTTTITSSAGGVVVPDATLPEGYNSPFELLRAAKRAGRRFGLGPQDLQLLELYLCFIRREDWAEGKRPFYTRSVTATAASLGVSPRSINTAERRLERLGLIRRATRADGARGGWGGPEEGALYGIDLTPLIAAQPALIACAEAARAEADRIACLRAAISRLLGEARRLTVDLAENLVEVTTLLLRLPARTPQARCPTVLEAVLREIQSIVEALRIHITPVGNSLDLYNSSDAPEESIPLIYNTRFSPEKISNRSNPIAALTRKAENGRKREGENSHGLIHLKGCDIAKAMPDRWHDLAGTVPGQFLWHRFAMAAQQRLPSLGVSPSAWREAVSVMGQEAAALSLMILDVNRHREINPVRNVAGALRGMTRRAESGTLRLHASVYGLLARDRAASMG